MEQKPYKRPESVLVMVCTDAGEVLLMERMRPRGFWQSVTGSLSWGESARTAAVRELAEETGLKAGRHLVDLRRGVSFPIVPPWRARYAPQHRVNREHWFIVQLPARRMIHLEPREHRQYRWLPASLALRRATSWTNRQLIREWMRGRNLI